MKMGSWLSTEEYTRKVLPTIVKLFSSNDCAIRVALLQHIDQYGKGLSTRNIDEQVYPHVGNGFSDKFAFLRELTLKSMLILAPLGRRCESNGPISLASTPTTENLKYQAEVGWLIDLIVKSLHSNTDVFFRNLSGMT